MDAGGRWEPCCTDFIEVFEWVKKLGKLRDKSELKIWLNSGDNSMEDPDSYTEIRWASSQGIVEWATKNLERFAEYIETVEASLLLKLSRASTVKARESLNKRLQLHQLTYEFVKSEEFLKKLKLLDKLLTLNLTCIRDLEGNDVS